MSQTGKNQHCRGCSCHDAPQPAQDMQQLVDLVKSAHSATAAMAEVVRAQSQALIAVAECNNPKPQPAPLTLARSNSNSYGGIGISGGMVLSERVGSISVTQWEEMSDDRLMQLDRVLKTLFDLIMVGNKSAMIIARTIRSELAIFGFVFKGLNEWFVLHGEGGWAAVRDTSLPDLVRMRAVMCCWRPDPDMNHWWVDEMMRVVVRWMELRGM